METMISERETGGRGTDMDSDAPVVLRRGGVTTTMKLSRTSRTESTAVFVGRASFQMIPARQKHGPTDDAGTDGAEVRWAEGPDAEEARQEVAAALRAEAQALRAESELRVAAATAARGTPAPAPTVIVSGDAIQVEEVAPAEVSPRRGVVLQARALVDVTEPIDARARSRAVPRGRRGGVSPRTIVLALVAGASITLSAEAVMRRPRPTAPAVAAAPAPRESVRSAPPHTLTASPPPAPAAPTVVASTATAPDHGTALELAPPAEARRKRPRARPAGATASAPKVDRQGSTAWIDPFAEPAPARVTKTRKASHAAWVDPFVD